MTVRHEQAALVARIREMLGDPVDLREVSMFGGRAMMLDDRMLVSAGKDGGLLVRVDPERGMDLAERPGAAIAEMGAGRSMGPGWIAVDADTVDSDDGLRTWLDEALTFHRAS